MNTDDKEIVTALRAALADRVGKDRYDLWLGSRTRIAVRNEALIVAVSSTFHREWLRTHFRADLEAVAVQVLGKSLTLQVVVEAAPSALPAQSAPSPKLAGATTLPKMQAEPKLEPARSKRPLATLEAFVVGTSNSLAHTVASQPAGGYSPIFIHGPTGVGKTHLLEGIIAGFQKRSERGRALYLTAEQFTTHFLEALHGAGLPSFRRKCRDVELLVIDDVQFFVGKRATLIELVHTVEALLRHGRPMVFAADRAPASLKGLGHELVGRLTGGTVCPISPPEFATRLGILRHFAVQLSMTVPDDVLQFIASRLSSQSRELAGALKRLKATSLAHGKPISLGLAEEALAELIDHCGRAVRLPDIEKAVCDVFGLQPDSLQSNRKAKTVSQPRMLAMWLARKHTRAALSEIGHFFGRRSHSTVVAANKRIERLLVNGTPLEFEQGAWKVEDTIRRVEEQLRAG